MFVPNTTGVLRRQTGSNIYGEPTYGHPKTVPCGVVRLAIAAEATSVRTDSSASRGAADEPEAVAKILFPANVDISIGDRFEIQTIILRCKKIEPRLAVTGKLDHWECDFDRWEEV